MAWVCTGYSYHRRIEKGGGWWCGEQRGGREEGGGRREEGGDYLSYKSGFLHEASAPRRPWKTERCVVTSEPFHHDSPPCLAERAAQHVTFHVSGTALGVITLGLAAIQPKANRDVIGYPDRPAASATLEYLELSILDV
ncbi:hypothetical protein EYF80_037531 [Liparis tanakae]|uniref:Uncharacterized protein n=1 Tax=Liparis tanakae TaxID=230148 RepID=A0A4Z2GGJ1_9TELE|nr:hypothetical protein EYF80_037531 [Liparis tanakae]